MNTLAAPPIFERMSALADSTRSRLLLVLERHELTVGEMCAVLQLPQSTVSRHLKTLADGGGRGGGGAARGGDRPPLPDGGRAAGAVGAAAVDAGARAGGRLPRGRA